VARPSSLPCDAVRHVSNNPVALCHPLPYGRRAAPSKKDDEALERKTNNYATPVRRQCHDVGPAGPVTSVTIGSVRPSRRPNTIPATVSPSPTLWKRAAPERRHASYCTPVQPGVNSTLEPSRGQSPNKRPLHRQPRSRSWTHTGRAMTPRQKRDSPRRSSTPRRYTPYLYTYMK
jgi:hypothetical protein